MQIKCIHRKGSRLRLPHAWRETRIFKWLCKYRRINSKGFASRVLDQLDTFQQAEQMVRASHCKDVEYHILCRL